MIFIFLSTCWNILIGVELFFDYFQPLSIEDVEDEIYWKAIYQVLVIRINNLFDPTNNMEI